MRGKVDTMNNVLRPVPKTAKEFVDDGVTLFLVLDWDGVFNPFNWKHVFKRSYFHPDVKYLHYPNPDWKVVPLGSSEKEEPKSYRIQWSTELAGEISSLIQDDRVQVIWLTTWFGNVGSLASKMGIHSKREMFYLPWGGTGEFKRDQFYKAKALGRFLAGVNTERMNSETKKAQAHMVWVDDFVLNSSRPNYRDGLPLPEFDDSTSLLLAPNENYGISRAELALMEDFTQRVLS